ncbi:MAG: transporter [Caulobacteraceae bacterium]
MARDGQRAIFRALGAALALSAATQAQAQAQADPICADRPGKAFAPCTAPRGTWQLETDLYDQTWDRSGGGTIVTTLYSNPTLKFGLTDHLDIEAALTPYQRVRTRDGQTGAVGRASGPGDLTLQAKFALSPSVALMPFVTAPTATRGLGAGGWEGGVRAPAQLMLSQDWSIGMTAEVDVARGGGAGGTHLETAEAVGLTRQLPHGLSLGAEVWGDWDLERSGQTQASFDLMAAWIPPTRQDFQLDMQVNLPLNRRTPDLQLAVGVAHRF